MTSTPTTSETHPATGSMSAEQASGLLMLTPERLRQLVKAGVIPRPARNQYPLVPTVRGYLAFLADPARSGRSEADRNLAATRTRQIEQSMAREASELVPADEVVAYSRLFASTMLGKVEELAATYPEAEAARMIAAVDAIRRDVEALIVAFDESREGM